MSLCSQTDKYPHFDERHTKREPLSKKLNDKFTELFKLYDQPKKPINYLESIDFFAACTRPVPLTVIDCRL